MRRCMLLLIPILAACGGAEPTKPPPVSKQVSLAIVGGNQQAAPVTSLLPVPIKVQVTESPTGTLRIQRVDGLSLSGTPGSTPAPGRLVRFVPDSSCGAAAVGYGITDSLGVALDRWTLGTHAKPCRMVTIGVDQKTGEIQAYDTAYATALPGAVDTLAINSGRVFVGESFSASALVHRAADRYGNEVANPTITATLSQGWTQSSGTVTAPSEERFEQITVASGARSATFWFGVVRDLRSYTFDATWACLYSGWLKDARGVAVDSVRYRVVMDTVSYAPDLIAPAPIKGTYTTFAFGGSTIWYARDGVVDTVAVRDAMRQVEQRPDSLIVPDGYAVRTGGAPLAYAGGRGACPQGGADGFRPLQMVAR